MRIEHRVPDERVSERKDVRGAHSVGPHPKLEIWGNQESPGHAEGKVRSGKGSDSCAGDQAVLTGKEPEVLTRRNVFQLETEAMATGAVIVGNAGQEDVVVVVGGGCDGKHFDAACSPPDA